MVAGNRSDAQARVSQWARGLVAAVLVGFGAAGLVLPQASHAAPPPAGSTIGNQATATYTDSGGTSRNTTSNLVQTTVAQIYSHTLASSQSKPVAPGGTVYFAHTLTNTGNGPDTYTLGAADGGTNGAVTFTLCTAVGTPAGCNVTIFADADGNGIPDNSTPITSSGSVIAGGAFKYVVAATWPGAVTTGSETVTVTTAGNVSDTSNSPAGAGTNTDTVTVTGNAVISVTKNLSVTSGPSPSLGNLTVTLTYTNTGSAAANNVTLFDQLPAGMTYAGPGVWSGGGTLDNADDGSDGGAGATIAYCANQGSPSALDCGTGKVAAQISSVAAGGSGTLTFLVSINSGLAPSTIANTARYCYNDGTGVVPAGCTVTPGGNIGSTGTPTNAATYTVAQTYGVDIDDRNAGSTLSSGTDTNVARDNRVNVASSDQGSIVTFQSIITNNGNGNDRFNITAANGGTLAGLTIDAFPTGTTFEIYNATNSALLTDTNGDGTPDTGVLAAGASTSVYVRAILPPNGTYTSGSATRVLGATVTATSVGNSAVSDPVVLTLGDIIERTVDLTNNSTGGAAPGFGFQATGEASAVTTNAVNPGTSTAFTLFVTNNGPGSDSFDLLATTNNAGINSGAPTVSLPSGWTLSFRLRGGGASCAAASGAVITNTGPIAASANLEVCAIVGIPANAAAGTTNIYFRAASPAAAQFNNTSPNVYAGFDVKRDAVTVNTVFNLSLTPNRNGQVFPAGNVVYSHQLCNNGNSTLAASSITLSFANGTAGFTSALWVDVNNNGTIDVGTDTPIATGGTYPSTLNAGTCAQLLSNVFAPAGATNGTSNTTTVTVTHASAGTANATENTTVVSGDLTITKEQRTVDCALGGAGTGVAPQATLTQSNIGTALQPNSCVQYRVTATNSGAANITSLTISDAIPAFTTLETAACTVSATRSDAGAVTLGGTAVDEAGGTVTATVATLPPGVGVVMEFCVQIDQ